MQIPAWAYLVGILCVIPLYFLWGVLAYGIVRALVSWLTMPEPPKPREQAAVKG